MFYLLLGLNALTDLREGCIYDLFSLSLFLCSLLLAQWDLLGLPFWISLMGLTVLLVFDRREKYLGKGDYLILLAVSLYVNETFPLVLLFASGSALLTMGILKKRQLPLVPFLFFGTLCTEWFRN